MLRLSVLKTLSFFKETSILILLTGKISYRIDGGTNQKNIKEAINE